MHKEEAAMKKIGMLTSGGDCQALNAAMRGVVKALAHNVDELEIYGFENGYKGLIYENYRILTSKDFSGILTKGGTILGSSRQPFKLMRVPDENGLDKVAAMSLVLTVSLFWAETAHKRQPIFSGKRDLMSFICQRQSTMISTAQM